MALAILHEILLPSTRAPSASARHSPGAIDKPPTPLNSQQASATATAIQDIRLHFHLHIHPQCCRHRQQRRQKHAQQADNQDLYKLDGDSLDPRRLRRRFVGRPCAKAASAKIDNRGEALRD